MNQSFTVGLTGGDAAEMMEDCRGASSSGTGDDYTQAHFRAG